MGRGLQQDWRISFCKEARKHLLSVHQVKRINLSGSMTVSADTLDVSEQRGILVPVIELFFGICDQLMFNCGLWYSSLQSGSSYLAGTLCPKAASS